MNKLLYICFLFFVIGCSCTSEDAKNVAQLLSQLSITTSDGSSPNVIIIIPGNGCESCIEDALDNIKNSNDTAYVFICDSEKEFFLLSEGKKASTFNNLYLDKEKISFGLNMVQSYPMVYFLKDGKCVSKEAYKPVKKKSARQKHTTIEISKQMIDWGDICMDKNYTDSICITNKGTTNLNISEIQTSCECVQAKIEKNTIPPSESIWLSITFQPEDKGMFERYVYVYANIETSPLEISIRGYIK